MREADRSAILRRRAAFVGSALTLLGCSRSAPPAKPPEPQREAQVSVPEPPADAEPSEPVPERGEPERSTRPTPSLEVPEGVSEETRERYVRLAKQMKGIYAEFSAISIPKQCDVSDASCEPAWRSLAERLLTLSDETRWIVPACKGSSESAKLFLARAAEHAEHARLLREELDQEIDRELGSDAAKKRWQELQGHVRRSRPRVCLSFACVDY